MTIPDRTLHAHESTRRVMILALRLRADLIEGRYDALDGLTYGSDERYNSDDERGRRIGLLQAGGSTAFIHDPRRAEQIREIAGRLIDDVVPVTDAMLSEISTACDGLSRIHTGQWHILIEGLILRSAAGRSALADRLRSSSASITDRGISDDGRVAFDVHQVVRRHLAYQAHPEGGWTVEYDPPLRTSVEPLIRVAAS